MNGIDIDVLYRKGRENRLLEIRAAILELASSKYKSTSVESVQGTVVTDADNLVQEEITSAENRFLKAAVLKAASDFSQTQSTIETASEQKSSFLNDLRVRFESLTKKLSNPWLNGAVALCSVSVVAFVLVFNLAGPKETGNQLLVSYAAEHLSATTNNLGLPKIDESLGFSADSNPQTTGIEYGALFTLNNRLKDRNKIMAYIKRFMFFSQSSSYKDKASALLSIYQKNTAEKQLNSELERYYLAEIDSDEKVFLGYWISVLSLSATLQTDDTEHLIALISDHKAQFVDSLSGYISAEQLLEFKQTINTLVSNQDANNFDYQALTVSLNKLKIWLGI